MSASKPAEKALKPLFAAVLAVSLCPLVLAEEAQPWSSRAPSIGNPRVSPASNAVIAPFFFIRTRKGRGFAFLNAWLAIRNVYAMKDLAKRMGESVWSV